MEEKSKPTDLVPVVKLQRFLQLYAPSERIDSSVIATMSDLGYELVVSILEEACQLASIKEMKTLEPKDIKFIAEKNYNILLPSTLPIFSNSSDTMEISGSPITTNLASGAFLARDDSHLRRMAHIRQAIFTSHISEEGNK